jgi:hypothetical protein
MVRRSTTRGRLLPPCLRLLDKGPRTVANNIRDLKIFFLHFGVKWPLLKTDKLRYTEPVVRAYNTDELKALMSAVDADEQDLFFFFVGSGAQEQEGQFAT